MFPFNHLNSDQWIRKQQDLKVTQLNKDMTAVIKFYTPTTLSTQLIDGLSRSLKIG